MTTPELFRRILVGIDADGRSNSALLQAAKLAQQLDSRLTIIQAVDVPSPQWSGIGEKELAGFHASALELARTKTIQRLGPLLGDSECGQRLDEQLKVYPGHAAKVLLDHAAELESDLIILGPHTKSSAFDFGSTTRAVLSRSTAPVWSQSELVVPLRRILVPVDFSEHSRRAMEYAIELAARIGASVHVLHCFSPPIFAYTEQGDAAPGPTYVIDSERKAAKDELAKWMQSFAWKQVAASSSFEEGDTTPQILECCAQADLIVMGTHGRTGLSRFLMGSIAHGVLKRTKLPVLLIPNPEQVWQLGEAEHQGTRVAGIQ